MRALFDWIDDRTGLSGLVRNCLDARIPGKACVCRVWPATIALAFCVQVITGFFIWIYYSPSAQTAWESVYYLQHEVAGGWLLRAMHHWSAQVLLVLLGLYLLQMIVTGAYRAPRELIFWTALLMVLVTLGLLLTGDLLAWDQNSYASTQVRVSFLELLPGVGGGLYKLAAGGPQFGHLTLTRFLALHICCMSGSLLLLLVLHVVLVRRADSAKAAEAEKTVPYWPNQAVLNATAMVVVLVVVLLLSVQSGVRRGEWGIELGSPADTSSFFAAARPEWAFLGLYEFSKLKIFRGEFRDLSKKILPIFVIPGLLVCIYLAMPWIARCRGGHVFNLALTAALLVGMVALSGISVRNDLENEEHQAALEAEEQHARRVVQLASAQGIPATGALTLLRNDPKIQGPILFKTHCASCHDYVDAQQKGIKAEEPSAPNLYNYATPKWVAGWLDLQTITGPGYFGNTKFRRGQMVENLEMFYEDLEEDELEELREDFAMLAAGLSAEAELKSQKELEQEEASRISQGRAMIEEFGCIDCHKFHDQGAASPGPDLTGYGSREWTVAIIANAADKRFYRDHNDRMPAYAEFPDDPAKNILSTRDIGLLADWLRGEWYEE
jgi:ubiquinol-cytochrome c reductase cytochrome b subunit